MTTTNETLIMLRDAARDFCAGSTAHATGAQAQARLWNEIAGLGWLGVAIEEEFGGSATGLTAAGVIARELGRSGHTRGYAETVAIAAALARAGLQTQAPVGALLRAVAEGAIQLSFVRTFTATHEQESTHGLLPDAMAPRLGIFAWSQTRGVTLHELDATARQHMVRTTARATDVSVVLEHADREASDQALTLAPAAVGRAVWDDALMLHRCLAAAQLIGAVQAALAMCIDYAKVRSQFGQLIGAFQAVQHSLVDMLAASDAADLLVFRALLSIDQQAADQVSLAASATAFSRETAWTGLMKTYDVLGGVGFIEEHPINRLTRAVLPLIASIGSASDCEDAVAAQVRRGHWLAQTQENRLP